MSPTIVEAVSPVAEAALEGLGSTPKTLPPWLFYDAAGSELFEQITELPEYYLTRTERGILERHAEAILDLAAGSGEPLTIVELGAGTATKTGILLRAAARCRPGVLYQPLDVSSSALDEARRTLTSEISGLLVRPRVVNYVTEPYTIERNRDGAVLALSIGSSIGNFAPDEAVDVLRSLRSQLRAGDHLLLGTDLAPGAGKTVAALEAAYDDAAGVTAAFNRNMLVHLNRELDMDFDPEQFAHVARWNAAKSRMEMHLESLVGQTVRLPASAAGPARSFYLAAGETIHTENSHKFTDASLGVLLESSDFAPVRVFQDPARLFAVTVAAAT